MSQKLLHTKANTPSSKSHIMMEQITGQLQQVTIRITLQNGQIEETNLSFNQIEIVNHKYFFLT